MICSQKRVHQLAAQKQLTSADREELINLLRNGGYGMPDCMFENAYKAYQANPSSDQKYIHLEEMIYNGLILGMEGSLLKKFLLTMKKKIGENTYIRRIFQFINFVKDPQADRNRLQDLIRDDMTDNQTLKKAITINKRLGKFDDYIRELNNYLEIQPMDEQAWLELGLTYNERGNYLKAAFCFEELIVLNPTNDVFTLKLAEMYLTLGGKDNTEKAVKYLSYLILKRPDNTRALWLLYRAVLNDKEQTQLKETCKDALHKLYNRHNQKLKIHIAL